MCVTVSAPLRNPQFRSVHFTYAEIQDSTFIFLLFVDRDVVGGPVPLVLFTDGLLLLLQNRDQCGLGRDHLSPGCRHLPRHHPVQAFLRHKSSNDWR